MDMGLREKIALIRVWNYNKSRTYASRGVREMQILLDGNLIFSGEIKKASGSLTVDNCEYIVFTRENT